jgi:hypothetical protein
LRGIRGLVIRALRAVIATEAACTEAICAAAAFTQEVVVARERTEALIKEGEAQVALAEVCQVVISSSSLVVFGGSRASSCTKV